MREPTGEFILQVVNLKELGVLEATVAQPRGIAEAQNCPLLLCLELSLAQQRETCVSRVSLSRSQMSRGREWEAFCKAYSKKGTRKLREQAPANSFLPPHK